MHFSGIFYLLLICASVITSQIPLSSDVWDSDSIPPLREYLYHFHCTPMSAAEKSGFPICSCSSLAKPRIKTMKSLCCCSSSSPGMETSRGETGTALRMASLSHFQVWHA